MFYRRYVSALLIIVFAGLLCGSLAAEKDPALAALRAKTVKSPTVVGVFSSETGVDKKIFDEVKKDFEESGVEFVHTSDPDVLEAIGFFGQGASIVMKRPQKPFKVTYKGTVFRQSLRDWVVENAVPSQELVSEVNKANVKLFALLGVHFIRVLGEDVSQVMNLPLIKEIAEENKKNDIKFGVGKLSDFQADVEAQCEKGVKFCVLAQEGFKKSRQPRIFGKGVSSLEKADLEEFIQDFLNKKLKPKIKSEAAPAAAAPGEVQVIVGSTFKDTVLDSEKDVFIKFYAPWCGHCKALAPKWIDLAKELKSEENLVIAEMDMTANDLPPEAAGLYRVEGFPTLYFAPKGKKMSPVQYDGGRDVESFKKWLAEKRSA